MPGKVGECFLYLAVIFAALQAKIVTNTRYVRWKYDLSAMVKEELNYGN